MNAHVLVIDNYDSFTYNLVQAIRQLRASVSVFRNDQLTVEDAARLDYSHLLISPGPGHPRDAGVSIPLIRAIAGKKPLLGVCLGHQALAAAFGARVERAPELMHGKVSAVYHDGRTVFEGLPSPFPAGRYHSILPFTHCITRYSKQKNAARDFIRFLMQKNNYERYILVQKGYGLGSTPDWENHPFWKKDPAVEVFRLNAKYGRNFGYAGGFNRSAAEVQVKYIIIDLFARVAKGDSTQSTIDQAERELKLVYEG